MPPPDGIIKRLDGCHKGGHQREAKRQELRALERAAGLGDINLKRGINVGALHCDDDDAQAEQEQHAYSAVE